MKHGEKAGRAPNSPEYNAWKNMRRRCSDPTRREYHRYGGRGITVCDRWQDFSHFLADMGRRPGLGFSLERRNNDGNYEPGNCRWATASEQCRNRRSTRTVEYAGKQVALVEAAALAGLPYAAVRARLSKLKWPVDKALATPLLRNGSGMHKEVRL